jgi:hypothetical protein
MPLIRIHPDRTQIQGTDKALISQFKPFAPVTLWQWWLGFAKRQPEAAIETATRSGNQKRQNAGSGKREAGSKRQKAKRKGRRAICLFPGACASSAPVVGDFNLPG